MEVPDFQASRRFADVTSGRIAYVERGSGPAALFLHGVPLNGFHWRHLAGERRCIALDLMGLGYTEISAMHMRKITTRLCNELREHRNDAVSGAVAV